MFVCVCGCVSECVCVYIYIYIYTYMHSHTHIFGVYIHTYIYPYIHTHNIHAHVGRSSSLSKIKKYGNVAHTYNHAYIQRCTHIHAYIHTCIHAHIHTRIFGQILITGEDQNIWKCYLTRGKYDTALQYCQVRHVCMYVCMYVCMQTGMLCE